MNKRYLLIILIGACLLVAIPVTTRAQTDVTCEDLAPPGVPPEYFVGLGNAYFDEGDFATSVIAYTCALDLNTDYAPAYINRGYAYAIQHSDEQAMSDYNRALEIDEGLVAAYNNRGLLYMGQGNFGLAINDFTLAVTLDAGYAIAYHNRGLVHAAEGHYDLAIDDFQQAIALDPAYAAPHAALGAVYSAMALASYENYAAIAGETVPLPAGEPDTILNALAASQETGTFSIWLAFLTPAP